jgi:hypothetical protein
MSEENLSAVTPAIINSPECETMSQKHLPRGPRTNGNHAGSSFRREQESIKRDALLTSAMRSCLLRLALTLPQAPLACAVSKASRFIPSLMF